MGKTATNLVVILGIITVGVAGYYLYNQQTTSGVDFNSNEQAVQDMLKNTQAFIGYGQTLREVKLDLGFFEDDRFRSLRSYTTQIHERPIGRPNPFDDPVEGAAADQLR